LEWHGHNDFHKVLANATAAWLYGCMYANGTILGYGERTGNPPLEGLLMDYEIYNVFDTAKILGRPPRVAVDKTSGAAGIAWWINSYFGLGRGAQVEKRSAEVLEIAKWVDAQYDDGRTTSISDQEMEAQVRRHLPRLFESGATERLAG